MNTDVKPGRVPPAAACQHAWVTVSRHSTSQGTVAYVRCVRCRVMRVELGAPGSPMPASPVSYPVTVPSGRGMVTALETSPSAALPG